MSSLYLFSHLAPRQTVWILLVLRFGPKFYLQEDSKSVAEDEGDVTESEHDLVKERWLQSQAGISQHTLDSKEETFSEKSEQQRVSFIQAGFPESLTTEDLIPSRSSVHTLGSTRSTAGDSVATASERRRSRHRSSTYDPPTFHS